MDIKAITMINVEPPSRLLKFENRGQAIASTNYWDSEHAKGGFCYLSWNAGAARLLIPDSQKLLLHDMRSADYVIISRGPWTEKGKRDALELLFEDNSERPFCLHMTSEQTDRLLPESEQGSGFVLTVWTRGGLKLRMPGRYRTVREIPCLMEWGES